MFDIVKLYRLQKAGVFDGNFDVRGDEVRSQSEQAKRTNVRWLKLMNGENSIFPKPTKKDMAIKRQTDCLIIKSRGSMGNFMEWSIAVNQDCIDWDAFWFDIGLHKDEWEFNNDRREKVLSHKEFIQDKLLMAQNYD